MQNWSAPVAGPATTKAPVNFEAPTPSVENAPHLADLTLQVNTQHFILNTCRLLSPEQPMQWTVHMPLGISGAPATHHHVWYWLESVDFTVCHAH